MRRRSAGVLGVLVSVTVLAGCSDPTPPPLDPAASASLAAERDCSAAVSSLVLATQRYVDSYAAGSAVSASGDTKDPAAEDLPSPPAPTAYSDADFRDALASAQQVFNEGGCDPETVRADLEDGLAGITAQGAVADAVLRQVTASMTGRLAAQPTTRAVLPGDDLAQVLAESPAGSTVELGAGEYTLDRPLVVLAGVTLRGAGRDASTIVSTASEAAVLVVTDGRVEFADLTVQHEGDAAASALLAGSAASVVTLRARFGGGKADADGQAGAGILMSAREQDAAGRGTTLEVTRTEVSDNEVAGIVLTGGHRASVVRGVFRSNGQCGICFVGTVDGSVQDSRFAGNGVGIAVTGTATPSLLRNTVIGGEVGVQVSDAAAPLIEGATISRSQRAAMLYTGTTGGARGRRDLHGRPLRDRRRSRSLSGPRRQQV